MTANMRTVINRLGFMQGRLSPMVGGKIQAFPWDHWQEEFAAAQDLGLGLMEWTIDQERLHENPLMRADGRETIRALMEKCALRIPSLTGDCFMQAPFWKEKGALRDRLVCDFEAVIDACGDLDVQFVVFPLVDNGRLESRVQEDGLVRMLDEMMPSLSARGVKVVFECDYKPAELARLMERLDPSVFGVNYDIGNSAALGFDPQEELRSYGERILNVHVKDRLLGGTTVPLGTGNADFEKVFAGLGSLGYRGNYIMQTARASDGNHGAALEKYRNMTTGWIERYDA
jgi:L-ribulose-5-phosphate 3-epimerase